MDLAAGRGFFGWDFLVLFFLFSNLIQRVIERKTRGVYLREGKKTEYVWRTQRIREFFPVSVFS